MDKIGNTFKSRDGSTIALVVIFTGLLGIAAASLLRVGTTELRLNKSNILYNEARYGAESVLDYGAAVLQTRWGEQTFFNANGAAELRSDPVTIPGTAFTFFSGDEISLDQSKFELVGGQVSSGTTALIDPIANPMNPLRGKTVTTRDVKLYGKAVATDPNFGSKGAYVEETLKIIEVPLFSHAIYYEDDLEFHPGSKMDIYGPVHSNSDIYLKTTNVLTFHSTLSAAGDILMGDIDRNNGVSNHGVVEILLDPNDTNSGQQFIRDPGGDLSAFDNYYQSDDGDWNTFVTNDMRNMVASATSSISATKMKTPGVSSDVADYDYPEVEAAKNGAPGDLDTLRENTENGTEQWNPMYVTIEPLIETSHPNFKGKNVRDQQYSFKAGLTIQVERDASAPTGYKVSAYTLERIEPSDPYSPPVLDGDGNPKKIFVDINGLNADLEANATSTSKPLFEVKKYSDVADPTLHFDQGAGFYDTRQDNTNPDDRKMDVFELNIEQLASIINDGQDLAGNSINWTDNTDYSPYYVDSASQRDWNGIVYVEMPYDDAASARLDRVMPADKGVALRLNNGQDIPNPQVAQDNGYPGLTLATNGQLYVKGHYNSDGTLSPGGANTPDSNEAPAALLADAITVLSSAWSDDLSTNSKHDRIAVATEISAAFVTGINPTIEGVGTSGGAHNLPRFIEKWTNAATFQYRGSLVCLFTSEVGTGRNSMMYYSPPKRDWGFNHLFRSGGFPPGTPTSRTFSRSGLRYLTEAEYDAAVDALLGDSKTAVAVGNPKWAQ